MVAAIPDACLRQMKIIGVCGNGVVETGEECDDGDTTDTGNGCSAQCRDNSICGDGEVQSVFEPVMMVCRCLWRLAMQIALGREVLSCGDGLFCPETNSAMMVIQDACVYL